jgi:predicted dehydrogenase
MLRIGITGIGFMGMIHYLACQESDTAEIGAICSRDPKKLAGDWRGIKGNFGPEGTQMDLGEIGRYEKFEDLLADDSIDCIDLCLPPHMHADFAIAALEAGKHVFCEKPMAISTEDCDRMLAAAETAGKQLTIGHVLPFHAEYAYVISAMRLGTFGKPLGGSFKRVISDPLWLDDFYDPAKVGGPLVDLHVHDAHFIRYLFGMPRAVSSRGRMRGEVVEYCHTIFDFEEPLAVTSSSGVINQQGRAFTHGFEIQFEQATLIYDFAVLDGKPVSSQPLTVLKADGTVELAELPAGGEFAPFTAEIDEVAHAIEQGIASPLLSGELARDAIVLCHKQTESVRGRCEVAV